MVENLIQGAKYNLIYTLTNRFSGLILTIILARILMPELFGLYSLALSIALVLMTFTDLGVNLALTRYVANALSKKNKSKARQYFRLFLKIKIGLSLILGTILLILAHPLSIYIFKKPDLFWPLIGAAIFIFISPIGGIFGQFFFLNKEVKHAARAEMLHQITRIGLTTIFILLVSQINTIVGIFLAFSIASMVFTSYGIAYVWKKQRFILSRIKEKTTYEKKRTLKFLGYVSISSIGLIFLGSVDTLMLGAFVDTTHLSYYRVALSLVITLVASLNLTSILLPVFSGTNKNLITSVVKKVLRYTKMIAIPATVGLLILSKEIIITIFGKEYLLAMIPLIALAPIIILMPIRRIFGNLCEGAERADKPARAIIYTSIINIILNYGFIYFLIPYGPIHALVGAGIATTISQIILLFLLANNTKKLFKINLGLLRDLKSPIIGSIAMAAVIILLKRFITIESASINLLILVPIGIITYLIMILITKGIKGKELIDLIKGLKK